RRRMADVFAEGDYFALPVLGARSSNVLAFMRTREERQVLVVVPRLCSAGSATGAAQGRPAIDPDFWADTGIVLPRRYIGIGLHDVLAGTDLCTREDGMLPLRDVLGG